MLTTWQLLGLCGCCVTLAASLGVTIVTALVSTSDHKATFGHLMQDPLWFVDGKQVVFFAADKHNPMLITFLALASSYDAAIYIIIMITGLAVFRSIKEASKYMSAKTKYMQSQMNRVLFAEVS
ncbi:hypothetical protein AAVH_35778 [Aphelenchoides avenae]|nr:hypothetical protein AAVH_35778 [Aphelenchus avenae]